MSRLHTREDSGIRLDRQLRWWHDDEPVEHPRIIEAFNQALRVADDGRYKLELGADWCFVTVEDAAFEVRSVDLSDGGRPSVRLSDRTAEWLDVASLSVGDEEVLVVRVKGGRAKARFSRAAQAELGAMLEPDGGRYVLVAAGQRWPTSLVAPPKG